MKAFKLDSLNRKAMAKITMINKLVLNHSSELVEGFDLPLCREKNGAELSSKDFETLFTTYNYWRVSNGLPSVSYTTRLYEVGNVSTEEKSISMETFTVKIETLSITVADFDFVDTPSEFAKRDGKAEKAKTAENKTEKAKTAEVVEKAKKIVSKAEEIRNEDKALEAEAKKFNAEVDKDNEEIANAEALEKTIETFTNRIALIFGEDTTKAQKKAITEALKDFAQSF